jgi:hypothetical protein
LHKVIIDVEGDIDLASLPQKAAMRQRGDQRGTPQDQRAGGDHVLPERAQPL